MACRLFPPFFLQTPMFEKDAQLELGMIDNLIQGYVALVKIIPVHAADKYTIPHYTLLISEAFPPPICIKEKSRLASSGFYG
jgi:hypothetical protein